MAKGKHLTEELISRIPVIVNGSADSSERPLSTDWATEAQDLFLSVLETQLQNVLNTSNDFVTSAVSLYTTNKKSLALIIFRIVRDYLSNFIFLKLYLIIFKFSLIIFQIILDYLSNFT